MCEICNGTHVIHEIDSFSIRTSCCPICGPIPDDVWRAEMKALQAKWSRDVTRVHVHETNSAEDY